MKIQTNQGPIDYDFFVRAESVRRGMLFRVEGRDVVAECDDHFGVPDGAAEFLGCHPALARREDCERFGIPEQCEQFGEVKPIDAAAHGFARSRDGGAVDLRRETPEGAVFERDGKRHRLAPSRRPAPDWLRFIGLDAPAHSGRALREKFCCDVLNRHMDVCCSLAIGDHDTHEDVATGVKWSAKPTTSEGLAVTFGNGLDRSVGESLYPNRLAALAEGMSGDAGGMYVPGSIIPPATFGGPTCPNCGGRSRHCCEPTAAAFCAFVAGLKRWAASPAGLRASQERALVALVAAVPEGLDPIGWRAAVLALREVHQANGRDAAQTVKAAESLTPMLREFATKPSVTLCGNSLVQAMRDAYQRALAPRQKVAPERKSTAWKTRGPKLPVDDGRDD
jgi:hypothetical protein